MPKKCSLPGCKSNYKSREADGYTTVFSFPKDPLLRQKWINNIPRKDWVVTSNSYVCIKHFSESDIDRQEIYKDKDGLTKTFPRSRPLLTPGAIPSIFPNLPHYLSKTQSAPRKDPRERELVYLKRKETEEKVLLESDNIGSFESFQHNYYSKLSRTLKTMQCLHFADQDAVTFYTLNVKEIPKVKCSIKVDKDLAVQIVVNNFIIARADLGRILPHNMKLSRWSQLEELFVLYINENKDDALTVDTLRSNVFYALMLLERELENEGTILKSVCFLREQLGLLFSKKRHYSVHTIMISFIIYMQSAGCYEALRENNILCLPHMKYLQQLSSKFGVSHVDRNQNMHFVKQSSQFLTEREKIVILQLDEIHVKQSVQYKSGMLTGCATNSLQTEASTVQTFMVSSAFGNFKEVVSLVPVHNLKSKELHELTVNVLKFLYECGFTVITVISDNNRINRSMFHLLSGSVHKYSFSLPPFTDEIYFMYDTVHILKCVRNNWLNLKDDKKTFCFPGFEELDCATNNVVMKAEFSALRDLYRNESRNLIKLAPRLNYKSVYPSNIERQNVNLALNIFHETTHAALLSTGQTESAAFVKIILQWWTIVNTKDIVKGTRTRNPYGCPFYSVDDERLHFLSKFLKWLEAWKNLNMKDNMLTKETFDAMYCSTSVLCKIIMVGLSKHKVHYILPGKFQTDGLEHRFSSYRQLSGANYNVSVTQIFESEKKLRIKSLLGLRSARYGNVSLDMDLGNLLSSSETNQEESSCVHSILINNFRGILTSDYLKNNILNEPGFLYVCGYVAHKMSLSLSCASCVSLVSGQVENTDEYFTILNRGGLTVPSDFVIEIGMYIFSIMQTLISEDYEPQFFANNVCLLKKILMDLSLEAIDSSVTLKTLLNDFCFCSSENRSMVKSMASIFCNILLNNYSKNRNSKISERKVCKKRKLVTFT